MATKLSNVIGAPFADYVLRQLAIRASNSSTGGSPWGPRTNEQVLYLANKTAWVRLVSSIDVTFPPGSNETLDKYIERLGIAGSGPYTSGNSLAQNWVLQAGTTKYLPQTGSILRQGIGPDGAYGLGGTQELGYRPMPGLTSVTIDTVGRLGSLRTATVNFKVWNMNQLNTVEALYFRLGYSMLLEWGHTQFFKNYDNPVGANNGAGVFVSKADGGLSDPFQDSLRKEIIQQEIEKRKFSTSGNYDGMLGIVSNFNWSLNQEGGYDCTLKLVGLGAVMDSVRINQAYKLPQGLYKRLKNAQDGLLEKWKADAAREKKRQQELADLKALVAAGGGGTGPGSGGGGVPIDPKPRNKDELELRERRYDNFTGDRLGFLSTYSPLSFRAVDPNVPNYQNANGLGNDFVASFQTPRAGESALSSKEAQTKYGGVYVFRNNAFTYLGNAPTYVTLDIPLISKFIESIKVENLEETSTGTLQFVDAPGIFTGNVEVNPQNASFLEPLRDRISKAGEGGQLFGFTTAVAYNISKKIASLSATKAVGPDNAPGLPSGSAEWTNRLKTTGGNEIDITANFQYNLPPGDTEFEVSVFDVALALQRYAKSPNRGYALLNSVSFKKDPSTARTADLEFSFDLPIRSYYKIKNPTQNQIDALNRNNIKSDNIGYYIEYKTTIIFKTNNIGFIAGVATPPAPPPSPGSGTTVTTSDASEEPKTESPQKNSYEGYESALHAMLTVIQYVSQDNSLNKGLVSTYSTIPDTEYFYADGCFEKLLKLDNTTPTPPTEFSLLEYAAKGFSSQLMTDNKLYNDIPYIGGLKDKPIFKNLCTSLTVKYKQANQMGVQYGGDYQVYIPLGYLLAFLNNMCLFYDSKQATVSTNPPATGAEKRPYVYIDFNPETNFCLTSPQQFSVDPNVCLIPARLTKDEYLGIFPPELAKLLPTPFDPQTNQNRVSITLENAGLNFQGSNKYQGKTMNIMVCTQYLLRILREYSTNDPQHAVALQPFLERVMRDINKALGNVNAFRVAYRDDTNTIQIQDDQYVPPLGSEASMIVKKDFYAKLKDAVISSGELPIFSVKVPTIGSDLRELALPNLGIARQMQLKTVMSTKLASMIAISAQASTGSVNATDHTSLSWLNKNFRDRYKPYIQDAENAASGTNTAPPTTKTAKQAPKISADQEQAVNFNQHVKSVYEDMETFSADAIDPSRNYYIERMSKVKSRDEVTIASPFIPAELELTLDGISGIIMGNAFNIPPSRLPLSLRGTDVNDAGLPLVGFIVNGLTHRIQNNEWTTTIKGQMIKLREQSGLGAKSVQLADKAAADPLKVAPTLVVSPTGGGSPAVDGTTSAKANKKDPTNACYVPPYVYEEKTISLTRSTPKGKALLEVYRPAYPGGTTKGTRALLEGQVWLEGFKPGSVSYRTNNPGNIGTNTNKESYRLGRYDTVTEGIQAQINLLNRILAGDHRMYSKDSTLYEYITVYDPPCTRDKTTNLYVRKKSDPLRISSYTNTVVAFMRLYGITNVDGNTKLSEIVAIR